ncbi:Eco57I restriction-modification methylase domain-containing protein [Thioflexithrix psekupsensis]|uniref:site-specific DNA-methyltransferase (adenine-specific) n=1 Tax=Thioflexithrix psekupsensis TaxID=1570016 RepID=A0A251X7W6_9GAMM|nr:DNA methyltransferase [Thioflexithrix psekupsensis]OUD13884.1 ATP-binding protein [Thioflexithrix psekupsensis]
MPHMLNLSALRDAIQSFNFQLLFDELGWNRAEKKRPFSLSLDESDFLCQAIAELGRVQVFVIQAKNNAFPHAKQRAQIARQITEFYSAENVLIFTDKKTKAVFFWLKQTEKNPAPREHVYFCGQSGDALMSKLASLWVDYSELNHEGDLSLLEVLKRLKKALDIEPVTKKFYAEFANLLDEFVAHIHGIPHEHDKRWYASVLVNRIMFIWFLQKKGFLDHGNRDYLPCYLNLFQEKQTDIFYPQFLRILFFEGFAKPAAERSEKAACLGHIPYLNGGLFLEHVLEVRYRDTLIIPDQAFLRLFKLFDNYSWSLDDSPTGNDNEINPDVLGYIFEKYINQKAFGAYYTRREITEYLSQQTIHRLILNRLNSPEIPDVCEAIAFDGIDELLTHLDGSLKNRLLSQVLPTLKLLDPACGSGAFLVAAMKTLVDIYQAAYATHLSTHELYEIKKQIITHNLFGVDIMDEATEIAKLRLFLALVASVEKADDLEPLPNVDFNIMAGHSLIGLLSVDGKEFDQFSLLEKDKVLSYSQLLTEKNRMIALYREATLFSKDLRQLRESIEQAREKAQLVLNQLLLNEFNALKIKFEQATWDEAKNKEGKPIKRILTLADIERLRPFHWGYEFSEVFAQGGFDAIIANPPWDTFKPNGKEFFSSHAESISKNKMSIKDFEKEQSKLLQDSALKKAWLDYLSQFPYISEFLRKTSQFKFQSALVNGKKTGSDLNLYKLFVEQSFNLLQKGGVCGIVIPSGIYTDLGATGLRHLLFEETKINDLFGLSNEKFIFDGIHHSFKFCLLTFEKGLKTTDFYSAFRINPREAIKIDKLLDFLHDRNEHVKLSVDLVKKLSPDSHSIMEFKSILDVRIAEKMLRFPLLGESLDNTWNLKLTREFDMTNDSHLFKTESGAGRLPLYEGKMIHQFTHLWGNAKYWLDEQETRQTLLGKKPDNGQLLDYQNYRLGFRRIASSTNERAMIATILPKNNFASESFNLSEGQFLENSELLFLVSVFNSFVFDYFLRQKISANLNMFYVYQMPVPRLTANDAIFKEIVYRAACLICTTTEFDDLKNTLNQQSIKAITAAIDPDTRLQLRAELDAIIAHLYGLTEHELQHVLNSFPLIEERFKKMILSEFLKTEQHLFV